MLSITVRIEHIGDVGVDCMIVTPHVYLFTSAALFDEASPDQPYAYAYARLVPRLTYGLYRIKWLWGCPSLYFSGCGICNGGPRVGCNRENRMVDVVVDS